MRIRRGLLFWGLFLIPLGAIPLLVRAGTVDPAALTDVWRLWPVALILLGLAVLLGRHQAGLVGVMVAALALGGLAGSALASGPQWIGAIGVCVPDGSGLEAREQASGTFDAGGSLILDLDCGRADVTTAPGSGWTVDVRYEGGPPVIAEGPGRLELRGPADAGRHRYEWDVVVPTDTTRRIDLRANAGASELDLAGAALDALRAEVNAGDLTIDASEATLDRLDIDLNAGRARVTFGAGSATSGDLSVNAGALELCVPPGVGLDLRVEDQLTFAHDLDTHGLDRVGDRWTRPGDAGAPTVSLRIDGNAASLSLDPEEGCR